MTRLARLPNRALWRIIAGALLLTITATLTIAHETGLTNHTVTLQRSSQHQEQIP